MVTLPAASCADYHPIWQGLLLLLLLQHTVPARKAAERDRQQAVPHAEGFELSAGLRWPAGIACTLRYADT